MDSRIFIDANVLLDFILKRERYEQAEGIYQCIEGGRVCGFISPSIVHILAYWTKKANTISGTKQILLDVCGTIEVVEVGHPIIMLALNSKMSGIEDSIQYYAALAHNMDLFISNDLHLKKTAISSLPVPTLTTSTHSQ